MFPKFFILYEDFSFRFSNIEEEKVSFQASIKLGKENIIINRVNYRSDPQPFLNKSCRALNSKLEISVYKSNLQKCVRRNKVQNAIDTAFILLNLDPSELLRRLVIVAIEDVYPFYTLGPIVWFMTAVTKGYELTKNDVEYILGFTCFIAEHNTRESLEQRKGELKQDEL